MMSEITTWIIDAINMAANTPVVLFFLVIAATFILEDAATIGAALLAADGRIDPSLALAALFTGIALGDLGLYGLGRYAATHRRARKWIEGKRGQDIAAWAERRTWSVVFASRFVPGLRLPTYVGAGFLRAPFLQFTLAVVSATAIWTAALFSLVYFLGAHVLSELGPAKWAIGAALIVTIVLVERHFAKRRERVKQI